MRSGKLHKAPTAELYERALEEGVITSEELHRLKEAEQQRIAAIQVDSFDVVFKELKQVGSEIFPG